MQRSARDRATGAFLAACAGCAALALVTDLPLLQGPRDAARVVLAGPEAALTAAFAGAGQALSVFGDISSLNSRDRALEAENARLRAEIAQLDLAGRENARLRAALAFEHSFGRVMVSADVIGRSPDGLTRSLVIDKGSADGLSAQMVVVGPAGLVGLVTSTSRHSAIVLTLADTDMRVNVRAVDSGLEGTLAGGAEALAVQFFPQPGHFATPGEWVLTSGVGGTFPAGIPVGRVLRFQRSDAAIEEAGQVAWAESYSALEMVMVVTDYHNPLGSP